MTVERPGVFQQLLGRRCKGLPWTSALQWLPAAVLQRLAAQLSHGPVVGRTRLKQVHWSFQDPDDPAPPSNALPEGRVVWTAAET